MSETGGGGLDHERRQARREARRRELARRRRTFVALSLLLVAGLAAAVALHEGGGSSASSRQPVAGSGYAARDSARHGARGSAPDSARGNSAGGAASTSGGAFSGRGASSGGAPGPGRVPILMYHVINPPPAGAPFPGLYVSASEFAAQMQGLASAGYHAITQDQMWAYWRQGTMPLPPGKKPIVVSFDNGYQSQYKNALPVLRRLGWVADENLQLTGLPPSQGGLSEAQVKGLLTAGWELDTQGFSHADLIAADPVQLTYQVATARTTIQRRYGVPVNWFCYPSGHYNAAVLAAVRAAGYTGSTTVVPGWAGPHSDPDRLPRLRVLGGTSPSQLLAQIATARSAGPPPASYP